jgi:hypothetical protein
LQLASYIILKTATTQGIPVIPAFKKLRKGDQNFKTSLGYAAILLPQQTNKLPFLVLP